MALYTRKDASLKEIVSKEILNMGLSQLSRGPGAIGNVVDMAASRGRTRDVRQDEFGCIARVNSSGTIEGQSKSKCEGLWLKMASKH